MSAIETGYLTSLMQQVIRDQKDGSEIKTNPYQHLETALRAANVDDATIQAIVSIQNDPDVTAAIDVLQGLLSTDETRFTQAVHQLGQLPTDQEVQRELETNGLTDSRKLLIGGAAWAGVKGPAEVIRKGKKVSHNLLSHRVDQALQQLEETAPKKLSEKLLKIQGSYPDLSNKMSKAEVLKGQLKTMGHGIKLLGAGVDLTKGILKTTWAHNDKDELENKLARGEITITEFNKRMQDVHIANAKGAFAVLKSMNAIQKVVTDKLVAIGKISKTSKIAKFAPIVGSLVAAGSGVTNLVSSIKKTDSAVKDGYTGHAALAGTESALQIVQTVCEVVAGFADAFPGAGTFVGLILDVVGTIVGGIKDIVKALGVAFISESEKLRKEWGDYLKSDQFTKYVDGLVTRFSSEGYGVLQLLTDAEAEKMTKGTAEQRQEYKKQMFKSLQSFVTKETEELEKIIDDPESPYRKAIIDKQGGSYTHQGGQRNDWIQILGDHQAIKTIFGNDGDDILIGSKGIEKIYGGDDDDFIVGGGGKDELRGGTGNDFIITDGGAALVDGGAGRDMLGVTSIDANSRKVINSVRSWLVPDSDSGSITTKDYYRSLELSVSNNRVTTSSHSFVQRHVNKTYKRTNFICVQGAGGPSCMPKVTTRTENYFETMNVSNTGGFGYSSIEAFYLAPVNKQQIIFKGSNTDEVIHIGDNAVNGFFNNSNQYSTLLNGAFAPTFSSRIFADGGDDFITMNTVDRFIDNINVGQDGKTKATVVGQLYDTKGIQIDGGDGYDTLFIRQGAQGNVVLKDYDSTVSHGNSSSIRARNIEHFAIRAKHVSYAFNRKVPQKFTFDASAYNSSATYSIDAKETQFRFKGSNLDDKVGFITGGNMAELDGGAGYDTFDMSACSTDMRVLIGGEQKQQLSTGIRAAKFIYELWLNYQRSQPKVKFLTDYTIRTPIYVEGKQVYYQAGNINGFVINLQELGVNWDDLDPNDPFGQIFGFIPGRITRRRFTTTYGDYKNLYKEPLVDLSVSKLFSFSLSDDKTKLTLKPNVLALSRLVLKEVYGNGDNSVVYGVSLPANSPALIMQSKPYGEKTVVVKHFEKVVGGKGNDTIIGNNQANKIFAKGGRDIVRGEGGKDILGANTSENHLLKGGEDSDTYLLKHSGANSKGVDIEDTSLGNVVVIQGVKDFNNLRFEENEAGLLVKDDNGNLIFRDLNWKMTDSSGNYNDINDLVESFVNRFSAFIFSSKKAGTVDEYEKTTALSTSLKRKLLSGIPGRIVKLSSNKDVSMPGSGSDTVLVGAGVSDFNVSTGGGNDIVSISSQFTGKGTIDTGSGDTDVVSIVMDGTSKVLDIEGAELINLRGIDPKYISVSHVDNYRYKGRTTRVTQLKSGGTIVTFIGKLPESITFIGHNRTLTGSDLSSFLSTPNVPAGASPTADQLAHAMSSFDSTRNIGIASSGRTTNGAQVTYALAATS